MNPAFASLRWAKLLVRNTVNAGCRAVLNVASRRYAPGEGATLVIAPHPDDETFGCGAMIARKRNEGLPVHVVFLTDGSASHPNHPLVSPDEIAVARQLEAMAALGVLGMESEAIHFFNEADGTLNRLSARAADGIVTRLIQVIRTVRPAEIFLPCCPDGSSEHDAAFALVRQAIDRSGSAATVWQFPVWTWWNPALLAQWTLFSAERHRHPAEDFRSVKRQAMACYRSQTEPVAPWTEAALPLELRAQFDRPNEYFFRHRPPPATSSASV